MHENPIDLPNKDVSLPCEFDINKFKEFILSNEEWLMNRILTYARHQGYSKYTSTLTEAWRLSISGLSRSLVSAITGDLKNLELSPDEDYSADPVASFGILEAKRHRERGVNLTMFLGLMKYYKQSYLDLIDQKDSSAPYKDICKIKIERFFDRVELGFCTEWCTHTEQDKIKELQNKNVNITNEKNRYLTIFETIHAPVVLIDEENRVENYNQAWSELFEESSIPGSIYYNKNSMPEKKVPWFVDDIIPNIRSNISDYTLEKTLVTKKGARYFQIKIRRILDISNKYRGMLIILDDLTELKKAEKEKIQKEKLEGVLEMAGAVCHEINQPLQVMLGQTELLKIEAEKDMPISENLDTIAFQITKMGAITRKLMNITKYETKKYLSGTIIDIEKASQKPNNE